MNRGTLLWSAAAVLLAFLIALKFISIRFNPQWLFTKYRGLYKYVIAQARHESNNFRSDLYKRFNNPWGMKCPEQRKVPKGSSCEFMQNGYYVKYTTKGAALADYLAYLKQVNFPTKVNSADSFVDELHGRNYFTAPYQEYLNGVRKWI